MPTLRLGYRWSVHGSTNPNPNPNLTNLTLTLTRLGYRWSVHGSTGQEVAVLPHFKGTLVIDEVTGEYIAWSSPTVRRLKYPNPNPNSNPNPNPNPTPSQVRHFKYVAGGLISFGLVTLAVMLQSLPDIYQVSQAGGRVNRWAGGQMGGRVGGWVGE